MLSHPSEDLWPSYSETSPDSVKSSGSTTSSYHGTQLTTLGEADGVQDWWLGDDPQWTSFGTSRRLSNSSVNSEHMLGQFIEANISQLRQQYGYQDLQWFLWLTMLPSIRAHDRTMDSCLLALSAAGLGQQHKDDTMIDYSQTVYAAALGDLSRTLAVPSNRFRDETVSAILSLLMFQYFRKGPRQRDYFMHLQGLAKIVEQRGPGAWTYGTAHMLFTSCRVNIIYAYMVLEKATFLADEPWQRMPWEAKHKTFWDQEMDLMTFIPGLHERFARVVNGRDADLNSAKTLYNDIEVLEASFARWFRSLPEGYHPLILKQTQNPELLHLNAPSMFPEGYIYNSLRAASSCTTYWACLVDLNGMLVSLNERLTPFPSPGYNMNPLLRSPTGPLTQGREPGRDIAMFFKSELGKYPDDFHSRVHALRSFNVSLSKQICMSIDFMLREENKMLGPSYAAFPLRNAINGFRSNLPETESLLTWSLEAMQLLESKGVWVIRKDGD